MKKYCSLTGVEINKNDINRYPMFTCKYPKLIVFSEDKVACFNLYTSKEKFKKNFPEAEPCMHYYFEDIMKPLAEIFPEIKNYHKEQDNPFFSKSLREILEFPEYTKWENENYDKEIEQIIVEFVIAKLIKNGWELMNKEGFWFKKKDS